MAMIGRPFRIIALAPLFLIAGLVGSAIAQQRVGVNSAVNPIATGTAPGAAPRRLVLGQEIVFNERITTAATGQTQILFVDGSSLTLGPTADMVIDEFVYDPNAGTGKLAASLTRGVFRFVGGTLSKRDNAVTMQTPSATIGVRGGVMLINLLPSGRLEVIFGYGKGITVTGRNGVSETITRPGFEVVVSGPGASPSAPAPAPPDAAEALLAQLDGRSDGNGGARTIPTEAMVANSGIANVISGDVAASRRAAAQTRPPTPQPPNTGATVLQVVPPNQLQVTSSQSQAAVVNAANNPTPSGTPVSGTSGGSGGIVITYAGLVKVTNDPTVGFTDQTGLGRIPYTNGMLTFAAGSPQNGIFSASLGNLGKLSFPLVPGAASFGPANTSSPFGPLTGSSFLSSDNTFFYADLQAPGFASGRGFIFGGQPVDPSFYASTGSARIFAFDVQPDAALQSPVPFITNAIGGNIPNPSVSPYYVAAPASSGFGVFNPNTNPTAAGTGTLQASLGINGQGANQSSVLVVNVGNIVTSSDSGNPVVGSGIVRGSFLANGTSSPVQINSSSATVPDGLKNNFFGSNAISGFVVDQNGYNSNLNFQQQLATQTPYGGTSTNYAFNQPVTASTLPSGVGASRTSQVLTGFIGGVMYSRDSNIGALSPYPIGIGTAAVTTDAANNSVVAGFVGVDNLGTNTLLALGLGSPIGSGSAFIDDKTFAAVESPSEASFVTNLSNPQNVAPSQSRLAMVTSGTVPTNPLLPNGLCQQCQFLQWGYWTGVVDTLNAAGTAVVRQDLAHINTWIAGIPAVNTPTTGVATYTGNALGSVFNNGASYLASGGFTNSYNFGTQTGTVAISNFDGRNFSGAVQALGGGTGYYLGNLSGSGLTGQAFGQFYGPGAPETGGMFAVHSPAGVPTYLASGIFAGRR
jgi:hypothetical protein